MTPRHQSDPDRWGGCGQEVVYKIPYRRARLALRLHSAFRPSARASKGILYTCQQVGLVQRTMYLGFYTLEV